MIAIPRPKAVVVNDDPVQAEWLAESVRRLGLDVVTFPDGAEALKGLRGSAAPDLLIVDLHMPRVDGWRFSRALRSPEFAAFNNTPLLITSATFSGIDVEEITVELGANAFLPVPFKPDEITNLVTELLAGRSARAMLTFLIVDPSADTRVPLALRLKEDGYRVISTDSGLEALRRLDEVRVDVALVADNVPDFVVTDLVRDLKQQSSRTSVIVITGESDVSMSVEMLCAGADGTLRRSLVEQHIMEVVHTTIRERSILGIREILEDRTRELWSSEARYRTLFHVMPEALILLDRDFSVRQANPVAVRLLGASAPQLTGNGFLSLIPTPDRARTREFLVRIQNGEVDRFETWLHPLVGVAVEVELTGQALDLGDQRGLVLVAHDLSERRGAEDERRRMETHLQHVQRLESLGVFAGGIAHDFNNLLAGIMGYSSLLRMDLPEDGETAEVLEQIELSARRASELAEQILAYSGRSRLNLGPLDLSGVVRELGTLIGPAISKKAEMSYDLSADLPSIMADSSLLRQVVMNLIINASDSLQGAAGSISVRTGTAWNTPGLFDNILSQCEMDAEQYQFVEVEDSGCGMSKETIDRIFDPFFSTKDTGRGLGLAATLGIVWQHKGAVEVQSVLGQGTTFRVWLPLELAPVDEVEESVPKKSNVNLVGSGLILVAEDEEDVRTITVKTLRHFGFEVLEACNGEATVELFREHHEKIRLVLLDLSMPVMDGAEALKVLRRVDPDVPIVMTSGYRRLDLDPEFGMPDRFLWKPYSAAELAECFEMALMEPEEPALQS
jgi:PAS domain S-box-containing protein